MHIVGMDEMAVTLSDKSDIFQFYSASRYFSSDGQIT